MNLARAELKLGVRMIYTAMFDEVNEGTGDMKLGASLGLGVSSLDRSSGAERLIAPAFQCGMPVGTL